MRDRSDNVLSMKVEKLRDKARKGACSIGALRKTCGGGAYTALVPSTSVEDRRAVEVRIGCGAVSVSDPRRLLYPTGSCHGKGGPSGSTCRTSTITLKVANMTQVPAGRMRTAFGEAPWILVAEAARKPMSHEVKARAEHRGRWALTRGRESVPRGACTWSSWPLAVPLVEGPPTKFEGETTRLGRSYAHPRLMRALQRMI